MAAINKDVVLVVSLVLSVVSLVLLFGVTWYFQSSLDLLQQQVEYDRELLFKLQEQINDRDSDNSLNKHDVLKRQSDQNCQCQDGSPGPKGPPGDKGEKGMEGKQGLKGDAGPPGPKGTVGDQGPRGIIGDHGPPGNRGLRGKKGNTGKRGPRGLVGPIGTKGDKGELGPNGIKGEMGYQGLKGDRGFSGIKGIKGETGPAGLKGEMGGHGNKGEEGDKGLPGLNGSKGTPGQKGIKGDVGQTGSKGATGQKGQKSNTGTVYIRWGHTHCPSTAQLVYSGRTGGPKHDQGGGSNPQCLPLDPNFLRTISGPQARGYMYGAEYETNTDSRSHVHGVDDTDVPCAVCYVSSRTAVYMVPAKYSCPSGWTREYYGYLMSSHVSHRRTVFTCIDNTFKSVVGSSADRDSFLFYFVEGRCGSLPCPPYDNNKELSCAVCTK